MPPVATRPGFRAPYALFALALSAGIALLAPESAQAAAPTKAENFRLTDHRGYSHELYRYADQKAIVLYVQGNGCPIARQSYPELRRIARAYRDDGVKFLMINANPQDTRQDVAEELKEFRMPLPTLMDTTQIVARSLGLERTCEVLVITPQEWEIVYRGPVDDRFDYGAQKPEATQRYLRTVLDAVVAGKPVEVESHAVKGCKINVFDPPAVTYNDIAPILQDKCVKCHRPGEVGPFAMDGHARVSGWAEMIREVLLTERMPPWHADPEVGNLQKHDALTDDEKRKLVAWVEAGAPRGDETVPDPLAALEPADPEAWKLGQPDVVLAMPAPYSLPAEGIIEYVVTDLPTSFEKDTWVRGIEVRPGVPEVVHHALVFIKYPEHLKKYEPDTDGGASGFFSWFAPGYNPAFYPEGTGKFIPAGATLQLQTHYVTNGKPHEDLTRIGLYLMDEPPAERLETIAASNGEFEIPPGKRDFRVTARDGMWTDMKIWSFAPHMHYRGQRMKFAAHLPNKEIVQLCSVPNFVFDWQMGYRLEEPFLAPAGTEIHIDGAFDNSATNPRNPDPSQRVRFGDQTHDEMFIGYMEVSAPHQAFIELADRREARNQRGREQFLAEHPEYLDEEPYTREELEGTYWRGGDFKFRFNPDNVLLVNDLIRGTWKVEDGKVIIDVVGEHFELDIIGKHLVSNGRYEIQRLE